MEVYFDNSATTKPLDEVVDTVCCVMKNYYGNPSSLHKKGVEAEKYIKMARENVAKFLNAETSEIIFTSGGTESNNTAILGTANALRRKGNHIITSKVEHPSVLNVFKSLESKGFNVTYLNVNDDGRIDISDIKNLVNENTILVSIMHVNNEIGAINDIEAIGNAIKSLNKQALFHVDAIQSFGKIPIDVNKSNIDLLSISSHKINGPKGIGALFVRKNANISPLILGGGQESSFRSGTENVPGIAGFGTSVEFRTKELKQIYENCKLIKDHFVKRLNEIDNCIINGDINVQVPYILNVSFIGVRSEVLLHALESDNIYVSSGSACSSHKTKSSHVLDAMNLKKDVTESAIRFSFGRYNTIEEVDICIESLKKHLKVLRKFKRR